MNETEDYVGKSLERWEFAISEWKDILMFGDDVDQDDVYLPVVKWHPEVDPTQEVLGFINANTNRKFEVLAVVRKYALIADCELPAEDVEGEVTEDPNHLDYQPGVWEFDCNLEREVNRHSVYEWHSDFYDDELERWVKEGMGFHGPRIHDEMKGCVVLMRERYGGWRPARRMFVWVSTGFLMPM